MRSRPFRIALLVLVLLAFAAMFGAIACADSKPPTSQPAPAARQPKDDTPALLRQLNKGGVVTLDAGRIYNIATPLVFTGSNVTIDGQGATLLAAQTLPINSQTGAGDVLTLLHCRGMKIRDLFLDANARARGHQETAVTVRMFDCSGTRVTGCTLKDAVCDAIYLAAFNSQDDTTACINVRIDGNTIDGAWRNAISVIHAHDVVIEGNAIRNVAGTAPESGIDIEANPGGSNADCNGANHDITIRGNLIELCARAAIQVPGILAPSRIDILNNTLRNSLVGVSLPDDGITDCRVVGNRVYGMKGVGIGVAGRGCEVRGNRLSACADWGIYASGGGHLIGGNLLTDCPATGPAIVLNSHGQAGASLVEGNKVCKTKDDGAPAVMGNGDDLIDGNH